MDPLTDPAYRVPAVPDAAHGVAWLRSRVARFCDGPDHRRRRKLAEDLLAGVDPDALRRPGDHVATLAEALGVPRSISASVSADVDAVAAAYQPHTPQTPEADRALERLVEACGGVKDERTAALIGLLVQACAATRAMIAGDDPPVPVTRRVDPSGAVVEVDLTGRPFGAGPHACPGRAHALALVEGGALP
ncbi:hypothetical protein [Myceligenerans pegani]|uniref:Cytochrome P450 n=1 Tax=Myceligenerans pegani TaxID=2776917 RepID=A0ABR9N4V2_9MICO|nr:hypothetical protein [Myceligenerans sp. TRM 65318]MBE1878108.1 hypothetical protein [Myceligenerans sp. TRM 65318]MBE3020379.1 hypothetical protein [Myceligenerans sp. TRM 65318]